MWRVGSSILGLIRSGHSLENEGNVQGALRLYEEMLPYSTNLPSTFANTPEYQSWTEMVLSRYCTLCGRHVTAHAREPRTLISPTATISPESLLAPFRAYAKGWDTRNTIRAGRATPSSHVWQTYYNVLSVLFQHGIVQPIFTSKMQQIKELKSVGNTYEAVLLKEVKFPRADQSNPQVESWTDQVMANWCIIKELPMQEGDLTEVGKAALCRDVLEVGHLSGLSK